MLIRKEIENYLFDPLVVTLLPKSKQLIWKDEKLAADGKSSALLDYKTGEVKDYLKSDADKMKAAEVIRKNKDGKTKGIYNELLGCLTKPT